MFYLSGAGVSEGIAIGRLHFIDTRGPDISRYHLDPGQIDGERQRFDRALATVRRSFAETRERLAASQGSHQLDSFLEAHSLMIDDPLLTNEPMQIVEREGVNIEWALEQHVRALSEVFKAMDDPYLSARGEDVQEVVQKIQSALVNQRLTPDLPTGDDVILVTDSLGPADAVLLKQKRPGGLICAQGSSISHTAILCRGLKLPGVMGIGERMRRLEENEMAIIDGREGWIIIDPTEEVLDEYRRLSERIAAKRERLRALRELPAATRDGTRVQLLANVELPSDISNAIESGAEGIGLFRTEYLYFNTLSAPSEETQYRIYSDALARMDKPVVIRTLDFGGDKGLASWADDEITDTGPLGIRGLRFSLYQPALFISQLRALLRAGSHGDLGIMVPMLTSMVELDRLQTLIDSTREGLVRDGLHAGDNVRIGVMIEVPAAAVMADLIAKRVDFLSIGTNDLVQYTLAIDRANDHLNYLYDIRHPALLRLIRGTIEAADAAGIPCSMCGEMAGDPEQVELLISLGLRQFSMDPSRLLEVKQRVRSLEAARSFN